MPGSLNEKNLIYLETVALHRSNVESKNLGANVRQDLPILPEYVKKIYFNCHSFRGVIVADFVFREISAMNPLPSNYREWRDLK